MNDALVRLHPPHFNDVRLARDHLAVNTNRLHCRMRRNRGGMCVLVAGMGVRRSGSTQQNKKPDQQHS
jgi:hypothetical protein